MTEKEKLVNDSIGISRKGYINDDYIQGITKFEKKKDEDDDEKKDDEYDK